MAVAAGAPDKLSVIVYSGAYDRVHYALVVAAAAAAIGRPVTLFFTMGAMAALGRSGKDKKPAWRKLPLSEGKGTGGKRDDGYAKSGVATFEELLSACVQFGVKFMVCEMGLRAMGMEKNQLRNDVPLQEGGVVTFLNDASKDGAVLFI
jgi:peroxiredoxin family protein